jgi:hypothetical protein
MNDTTNIQEAKTPKYSRQLGTRVPSSIEQDLEYLMKKTDLNMSKIISRQLQEYVPIKKLMVDSKYILKDMDQENISFIQGVDSTLTINIDGKTQLLTLEAVKCLVANLFIHLIDNEIHG